MEHDIETPDTIHRRFDIQTLETDVAQGVNVMSMPVASAAVNLGAGDAPQRTASVRVNFLRPFFAGQRSRYAGTALRIGKGTAIGDATAVGDDEKLALVARITAYR